MFPKEKLGSLNVFFFHMLQHIFWPFQIVFHSNNVHRHKKCLLSSILLSYLKYFSLDCEIYSSNILPFAKLLPVIMCVIPVIKVNEQTIVDNSSNCCHTDWHGILPVSCLQFHPCSETRWSHGLRKKRRRRFWFFLVKLNQHFHTCRTKLNQFSDKLISSS